jgi:hypothetical protein
MNEPSIAAAHFKSEAMTIHEAIKATVGYEIPDSTAQLILLKRGLKTTDEVTQEILNSKDFELATADCCKWILTCPDVKEGSLSISMSDKKALKDLASGIYQKWGITDYSTPTARFISMG